MMEKEIFQSFVRMQTFQRFFFFAKEETDASWLQRTSYIRSWEEKQFIFSINSDISQNANKYDKNYFYFTEKFHKWVFVEKKVNFLK